jgi:hypothetical protein
MSEKNHRKRSGKNIARKRNLKVYTGKIPDVDVEEAIRKIRDFPRL